MLMEIRLSAEGREAECLDPEESYNLAMEALERQSQLRLSCRESFTAANIAILAGWIFVWSATAALILIIALHLTGKA